MPFQRRLPGKQIEPRLQLRAQKCQQTKAQPARGAGARLARKVVSDLLPDDARQPAQATFGQREILRAQTFLRPIDSSRAPTAKQAIPHVCSYHNVVKPAATLRSADARQSAQLRPLPNRLALAIEELPAQGSRQAESAIVGGTPADAHAAAPRASPRCRPHHRPKAERVELDGMEPLWRQPCVMRYAGPRAVPARSGPSNSRISWRVEHLEILLRVASRGGSQVGRAPRGAR